MRKKGRTDANQKAVVEHLRKSGLSVAVTSPLGDGFPDLVVAGVCIKVAGVSHLGITHTASIKTVLVELKDPNQPPSARKLSPDENKFHDSWKGEIVVVTTAEEVLKMFNK